MFLYGGIGIQPAVQEGIRNFSLRDWRKWHRPEDEDQLKRLGVDAKAAEVVADVAELQARNLAMDEQQRLEQLARELELKGIEWDSRYLKLLNAQREQLIDEEIGRPLRTKQVDLQAQQEASILLLLMTL